jgi:glycosyltransferase involved in cell wall biosynthesis
LRRAPGHRIIESSEETGDRVTERSAGAPLSILQILEKGNFNTGSVVQMYQLALGLASHGHRVAIATRPGGEVPARARADGIEVVALPLRHELDLSSARRLARFYDDRRVDLVHAHKGIGHSVALAATFFSRRRPQLVANRGVSFPLDGFNRWKYRVRLAAVVTVCEDIKRVIVRSGGLPPEKVHVVYAGVDLSLFDPEKAHGGRIRREWGVAEDETLLLQVSAREYKGWRDLLAGAAMIARDHPKLKIALVACPDEEVKAAVLSHARSLGIGERVIATGYRRDMPDVLSAADVVADLSWGGLGITGTLREAMALERPVIASSAGGNPELVENGRSGLLVPPRDPPAFAAALERVLGDRELARSLGEGGRRRVAEGFTVEARVDGIEALYRRLIAERATTEARG